jgi:hypothetical protein
MMTILAGAIGHWLAVRELSRAIAEMKAEARAAGLTDADIDAELAAFNAKRRDDEGVG